MGNFREDLEIFLEGRGESGTEENLKVEFRVREI